MKRLMLLGALLLISPARADEGFDHALDNIGLELRAFAGAAPNFGSVFHYGADVRLVFQGRRWGFTIGGRAGAAGLTDYAGPSGAKPTSEQIVQADLGLRYFFDRSARTGWFAAVGADGGSVFVDTFGFRHADAFGGYVEAGVEFNRNGNTRLTMALRASGGMAFKAEFSRIPGDGGYFMITLNVGVLFGGPGTGNSEVPSTIDLRLIEH
jgi:hypothetical protein